MITSWRVSDGVPAVSRRQNVLQGTWWAQRREASLNWLALGVLLAAWNAVDGGTEVRRRPQVLRGYSCVSVRGAQRALPIEHGAVPVEQGIFTKVTKS
jgi:hypothetical protein